MGEEHVASELTTEPIVNKDVPEEKAASAPPQVPAAETEDTADDSKALVAVEEKKESIVESVPEKNNSLDRDTELVRVNEEKRVALVKAWEENEKAKAENKYHKAVSNIVAWETTKKSSAETKLRQAEEKLEQKKAAYVEKMKNEIATIHKRAEEKKAIAEAKRGEEFLKAEEMAAKHRATGFVPKKLFACFSA